MTTDALFSIILTDLHLEGLKAQAELERLVNSDLSLDGKVLSIKDKLRELVINDLMVGKFKDMITTDKKE